MSKFYEGNREKISNKLVDGSILIVFSGTAPVKRGDDFYAYVPQRNFYYATGINAPNLAFVQKKGVNGQVKDIIYLERYSELVAKWDGAVLDGAKACELGGINNHAYIDELYSQIAASFVREKIHTVYLDLENRSFTAANTPELDFAKLLREKFPDIKIKNAHPLFADCRLIKSTEEIGKMKHAANITNEAFNALLANVGPGMMEYELEAHIDYTLKKSGCKDRAFATIMAAGKNACVLHYRENDGKINDGDLVLVDFGACWGWYSADVSRAFPANGKFSQRQATLYNIVLGGNKMIIDMVKPGVRLGDFQEALKEYYVKELMAIGLIKDKEELSNYYYHGVSHMLGLETHDVGYDPELILAPGMVITVEPGLYIDSESIGIRIEDDILVTQDGYENLTADIIKEIADIESYMAEVKKE